MLSGKVESVTPDWRGDTLAVAVDAADDVLTVLDTTDFDEDPDTERWLVIADSDPLEYVAVDHDANTITLADPAGADHGAGGPVFVWDPTVAPNGAKVVEYEAVVITDRGAVRAIIPHELVQLAGVENLVGASVTLDEDDDGTPIVGEILGREPRIVAAGAFKTDTGFDDIEIVPGNETTPAKMKFLSDGEGYNLDDPAGISCFDEPGFIDGTDFYVQVLGARATGDGVNARPRMMLYTSHSSSGTVSSVDLLSGGSDADFGFVRFFIKGSMKARIDADGLKVADWIGNDNWVGGGLTAANITDAGRIIRDTSSERYKQDIEDLDLDTARQVLGVRAVTFRYRPEMEIGDDLMPGFIAEEVHAAGAEPWVTYKDGEPDGVRYAHMTAAHHVLIADLVEQVEALKAEVAALKNQERP